jgi:aspartate carbamoyltransferase catalytic subunit
MGVEDPFSLWTSPHLLSVADNAPEQVRALLRLARDHAETARRVTPLHRPAFPPAPSRDLAGRQVATLFFEDSTRTRGSFASAAHRLAAGVVDLSGGGTSVSKGETLLDTALTVEAFGVDAIVVRTSEDEAARELSARVRTAVISGGSGSASHPTQGLLDAYTLAEAFERHTPGRDFDLSGLRVVIVGDVAHSRVARSAIEAIGLLGGEVVCAGPAELLPEDRGSFPAVCVEDLDGAIEEGADALMALRVQRERGARVGSLDAYVRRHQVTAERVDRLRERGVVMHPGPMNRGVEIAPEAADGERSVILRQVSRGVVVRMAALRLCIGAAEREGVSGLR